MKPVVLMILFLVVLASCDRSEPPPVYFNSIEYEVNGERQRLQMIDELRAAQTRVDAAFERLEDTEIANAIVQAKANGAEIRIVADELATFDEGMQILREADIEVIFGNGELLYLPDPTLSPVLINCGYDGSDRGVIYCPSSNPIDTSIANLMIRPPHFNMTTHNYVIIDQYTVYNFASPFSGEDTIQLSFRAESEEMMLSYWRNFNQLHGGVFATTLSTYNGPLTSQPQWDPTYYTDRGEVHLAFNPSDRLVKMVIDEVYRARSSVEIITDSISEEFLMRALQYKAENGFTVNLVASRPSQSDNTRAALEEIGLRYVDADEFDRLPTIVVIDRMPDRFGNTRPRKVMIMSHALMRTSAYRVITASPNDRVEIYPSDAFFDGNMWILAEYNDQEPMPDIDDVISLFQQIRAGASP